MKLNIINQSSNIELTSYQIAFMESVLELARLIDDLPYTHHRFRDKGIFSKLFPNDFILNLPIYLVNREHFMRVKEYEENSHGNDTQTDIGFPDEKIYLNEDDLYKNEEILDNNDNSEEGNDRWRQRRLHERRWIEEIKGKLSKELGVNRNDKYKRNMGKVENTEASGFYYSNYSNIGSIFKQPAIFLNLESISESTNDHNEFLFRTTNILIHEICHYILDNEKNELPRDEFYWWMEESMANCLTLNILYKTLNLYDLDDFHYDYQFLEYYYKYLGKHNINQLKELFDYSKEFIISQPKNYQLGYYLFLFGQTGKLDISKYSGNWEMAKDKDDYNKYKQTSLVNRKDQEKLDWLNYVKYDVIKDKGAKIQYHFNQILDTYF